MKYVLILTAFVASCFLTGCSFETMGSISTEFAPFSQGREKNKEMKASESKNKDSLQMLSSNR